MARRFIGHQSFKGRGTLSNPAGRFEKVDREEVDDGWYREEETESIAQTVEPDRAKSVITTNDSPDVGFDASINPYRGCEHGCVYCQRGDTRILLADGHEKALVDIKVGDEIVGTQSDGGTRRPVTTRVLAHWKTHKPAHRIRLKSGVEVIASGDHRFLSDIGWKFVTAGHEADGTRAHLNRSDTLVSLDGRESIASIEPLPDSLDLFDITTGTGDFIANGVISHNCFARPSHAFMGLSPGLDFETKLFYKDNAVELLEGQLSKRGYVPKPIALGINTDGYQPLERRLKVTRSILEVLARTRHPVSIITKSALIVRDLDLLIPMARDNLVSVAMSVTSMSAEIKRTLEPRTASPQARLRTIRTLTDAGVRVGVMVAPVIPAITDHEMEGILELAAEAGATSAGWVLLRLPYELKDLFREWLTEHYPDRAAHVMSLINQARGGRDNDPNFGSRMRGTGPYAELLRRRFELAARKLGLNDARSRQGLETALFRPPSGPTPQMSLGFD